MSTAGEGSGGAAGVVTADGNGDANGFAAQFAEAVAAHRHFDRDLAPVPA
jgi:hypothetical protein